MRKRKNERVRKRNGKDDLEDHLHSRGRQHLAKKGGMPFEENTRRKRNSAGRASSRVAAGGRKKKKDSSVAEGIEKKKGTFPRKLTRKGALTHSRQDKKISSLRKKKAQRPGQKRELPSPVKKKASRLKKERRHEDYQAPL